MSGPQTIVLLGMMGAGKTAVSKLLSDRLGLPCVSIDDLIAAAAGKDIPRIFAEDGEDEFRQRETEVLRQELERKAAAVIDTGGGVADRQENREALAQSGAQRIYLQAPAGVLAERVGTEAGRPKLQEGDLEQQIEELLQRRDGWYREVATITFATDGLTSAEEVAAALAAQLQER